jgi:hypothetical protein
MILQIGARNSVDRNRLELHESYRRPFIECKCKWIKLSSQPQRLISPDPSKKHAARKNIPDQTIGVQ